MKKHSSKTVSESPSKKVSDEDLKKVIASQPVSNVTWVHVATLKPNHYNPNKVAPPELKLLKISILEDGWTQPIVVTPDYNIVDGFHRYTVAHDPEIAERTLWHVPIVKVSFDEAHKMMSTIRHNRARGTHSVLPMAEIVRSMIEKDKLTKQEIMERLQMEEEEVERLITRLGLPMQNSGEGNKFGTSFIPDVK